MIIWLIINSLARIGITAIIAYKLAHYRELFNPAERIGMGMAAAGGFLTVPQLWTLQYTPFEDWASALFSLGFFIYLCGRMTRHWRHARNNDLHARGLRR